MRPHTSDQFEITFLSQCTHAQRGGDGVVHRLQPREVQCLAGALGNIVQILAIAGRQHHFAQPGPLRDRLDALGHAAGVDWSAVAVSWLLHHPARILPVMGTNALPRIAALSDACRVPMDRQTWFELYTLSLGREVA